MKRQKDAVNFDEGLALQTQEEFDLLFVNAREGALTSLVTWFRSEDRESLLLGGQIGVGKSTLLDALKIRQGCNPDIVLAFDREPPAATLGGFWAYTMAKLAEVAICQGIGIPRGFAPRDFPEAHLEGWPEFCRFLTRSPASFQEAECLSIVHDRILEQSDLAERQCRSMLEMLQQHAGRSLRIVCEGVDKLPIGSPGMHSLSPILNMVASFKSLIEVNAIHLFRRNLPWQQIQHTFIPPFAHSEVLNLLSKRLGLYEEGRHRILPAIAAFSGGNPRQALRLLMAYDYQRGSQGRNKEESLIKACNRVRADYLFFSFEAVSPDILIAVDRDGYLKSGLLEGMSPAAQAMYKNWIILLSEPQDDNRWPAQLNPLLQRAQLVADAIPENPETAAIRRWADGHGVSPYGLEFDKSFASSEEIMNQIASTSRHITPLNIQELLDAIASSLFVPWRQDRILIAYRNSEIMAVARDYLIGKANEMGLFPPKVVDLMDVPSDIAGNLLISQLSDVRFIYNVLLPKAPDKQLLTDLDRRRDCYISFEMLWWVHVEDLGLCLQDWPQLRQLMSVYVLEDEWLGSLKPEEVQADLDYLALLEKGEGFREAEARLQFVLRALKERRSP